MGHPNRISSGLLISFMVLIITGILVSTMIFPSLTRGANDGNTKSIEIENIPEIDLYKPHRYKHPKVSSKLLRLAEVANTLPHQAREFSQSLGLEMREEHVAVIVQTHEGFREQAVKTIEEIGGWISFKSTVDQHLLRCWIQPSLLEILAASEAIAYIRPPSKPILRPEPEIKTISLDDQATISEGLAAMNVSKWHEAGHRGSNFAGRRVRVAIIDFGFQDYPSRVGEKELPDDIVTANFVDGEAQNQVNGTTKHGVACAEIIYDIAPDAKFYFAKISKVTELEQAVTWAISQEVDIISHSLGWVNEGPGDGTGYLCDIVKNAYQNGILWVTAAGNERLKHYGGNFQWMNIVWNNQTITVHVIEGVRYVFCWGFQGYQDCFELADGESYQVNLRWEDDWDQPVHDYDLYVVKWVQNELGVWTWKAIHESIDVQNGQQGQHPRESIEFTTSGGKGIYGFFVRRWNSDKAVNMEIFALTNVPNRSMRYGNTPRSIANGVSSEHALGVGAVYYKDNFDYESYTSEGPTNGPGGSANGGKMKPEMAGYAGVSTKTYGFEGFPGTSAAAPHVAGAAALLIGAFPNWTIDKIRDYLLSHSKDVYPDGLDNITGQGRVYLDNPPTADVYAGYIYILLLSVK